MIWFLLACALIADLAVGFFVGVKVGVISQQSDIQDLKRNLAHDRDFALCVLRRELANWMLRHDPDRYCRLYEEMHEKAMSVSTTNRIDQQKELGRLCQQYPRYVDFDLFGTRDHVLYTDRLSRSSYEEVACQYTESYNFSP